MENNEHNHGCTDCQCREEVTPIITPVTDLDALKKEIKTELDKKNYKTVLPWGNIIITTILCALTLISVAQMLVTVNIFNKLKTGEVKASTGAPVNNSVQSQPDMVGGC